MEQFLEFAGNHTLLVFGLVTSFFVLVFTELRRKSSNVMSVEPNEAVKLINNDAAVVDLRTAEAFSRGHIVNARNIPFDELDASKDRLNHFRNKPLVVVCDAGLTSSKAASSLRNSGFASVYGLKGGMNAWGQAGLPVVTGKKTRSKK